MIRRTKRFRRNIYRLSNIALWLLFGLIAALAIEALLDCSIGHPDYLAIDCCRKLPL
ncbi:hypothetical protein [Variovorax sp. 54]|uniref:hypothetical protein n=1 Tax=Variovorax sp. 54 TaxID=2035212 RepID=UPI0015D4AD64|nr:hypothetical protein [Variovorax sp. 54]